METERRQLVDSLVFSALERSPEEREAFIGEACGSDLALGQEVRSRLAAHEELGSFLETPVIKIAEWIATEKIDGWMVTENEDEPLQESDQSFIDQTVTHYRVLKKLRRRRDGRGVQGQRY